jgi:hypothetical protein
MAAQLDQNTMYSLRPVTEIINYLLPASARYGVIRDPQGTVYPNVYPNQDLGTFNFFEASSIRQVGNKYVTVLAVTQARNMGLAVPILHCVMLLPIPFGAMEKRRGIGRFPCTGLKPGWFKN